MAMSWNWGLREGAAVEPGTTLFQLFANLSTVWMIAEVPETQAAWIKTGNPAEAQVPALPGERFEGKVDYLYPELTQATRTLKVRVVINNPGEHLRPGMFATAHLSGSAQESVLTVPTDAVNKTGTRSIVIVADDTTHFRPAVVRVGAEHGGRSEVLGGLQLGQNIVASGQFLIDSEANLRSAFDDPRPGSNDSMPKDAKPMLMPTPSRRNRRTRCTDMLASLFRWSIQNRFLVLMATALLAAWGIHATLSTPLDALPDLSDTQVIIRTGISGTGAASSRGSSHLSADHDDVVQGARRAHRARVFLLRGTPTSTSSSTTRRTLYWARSRVLEYLNQVTGKLPPGAKPALGPDGTGVGWIYEYALVDHSGRNTTSLSCERCKTGS